mmetsp:Transcript_156803/g.503210  ORF Transcript_156803/g.503210 Transcript_156803/m.503210 type:complete len:232 (-) Transcript_156803:520-1215(-)
MDGLLHGAVPRRAALGGVLGAHFDEVLPGLAARDEATRLCDHGQTSPLRPVDDALQGLGEDVAELDLPGGDLPHPDVRGQPHVGDHRRLHGLRPSLHQQVSHIGMTDTHCLHQRGQAEAVADIGICMHVEQPTDNLKVAMGGRDVECRPSVVVGLVQALARIVQRLQNHDRSGGGGATDQRGFLRFLVLGEALGGQHDLAHAAALQQLHRAPLNRAARGRRAGPPECRYRL